MDVSTSPQISDRENTPRLTILIIEDNPVFSRAARQSLVGHAVFVAESTEEALEMYHELLPNITLLDIALPDGNGLDLLQKLTAHDPNAFIIMLTDSREEGDVQESIQHGAKGYIIKPFSRGKLQYYLNIFYNEKNDMPEHLANRLMQRVISKLSNQPAQKKTSLPAAAKKKQQNSNTETRQHSLSLRKKGPYFNELKDALRILFIDHLPNNLERMQHAFAQKGYQLDTALGAEEGLEKIITYDYPLILLDCDLPEVDSYFFANRIRQRDKDAHKHRFIVGLGKTPKLELNERWRLAGMNAYIQKPLPIDKIQDFIEKHLEDFFAPYVD